ncbi:MAG: hypothetical protein E6J34_12020 [Chloroflexi bacterium]|nr:MAG: hypothetical protein E6J34_12020 [Chloroflexota bacterium]
MIELFQMWVLVEVLGLICLPLTMIVFHNLPDRGWAFTKALGMALFAFCVWLPLMLVHTLPFSQLFIGSALLLLLACNLGACLKLRHEVTKLVRRNQTYIITTELIFLGMVVLLGWLRSYGPDIRGFEMYMDEGFIAAIMRSGHFPPNDMWYAGYSLNYYYYAHYMIAMLAKLLGQAPSIAFNTGIAIYFGVTAVNLFGVTCNIVAWARYQRKAIHEDGNPGVERADTIFPPLLRSIPYGLLTMVMALILGNLAAATQLWWKAHGDMTQYDWFAPSRIVDKTINEFPAFSFLLSCFHAHVLALAFTIMAIGIAFNFLLEHDGKGLRAFGRGWRLVFTLSISALILGGLFVMNGWDYPTYVGLTIVCIALQQWLAYEARFSASWLLDVFIASGALVALSCLLYMPFYLNFSSPSQGLGIVPATERSPLGNELLIYGLFGFVFLSLLIASMFKQPLVALSHLVPTLEDETVRHRWSCIGSIGLAAYAAVCLALLVKMPDMTTFTVATTLALSATILLFYNIGDRSHAFTMLAGTLAFVLIAGCEVFFLKDAFSGGMYLRMNTVFKFYFQTWALLSIASGAGLYFILRSFQPASLFMVNLQWLQRGVAVVWTALLVVLFLAELQRSNSLDGLNYLKTDPANPGDYDAILWLNKHVQGDPVIVEAVGDDYHNYARVSAFTGLPTVMGWTGHEVQWRLNWLNNPANAADFGRRGSDIDQIYTNPDPQRVSLLMNYYHAQYLYVGVLEYAKYPMVNLRRFGTFMQIVYNANSVTIYKIK